MLGLLPYLLSIHPHCWGFQHNCKPFHSAKFRAIPRHLAQLRATEFQLEYLPIFTITPLNFPSSPPSTSLIPLTPLSFNLPTRLPFIPSIYFPHPTYPLISLNRMLVHAVKNLASCVLGGKTFLFDKLSETFFKFSI